ncbi:MAG: PEGA domain-containing protein [Deltaproteobacteria bacterium]|nr:PEGA domain-containing protein [Deltaproteobacteria bacterium]MBK8715863.1 PEGA domain-containing protein [Deltaproteobacteria bacterium]MBP7286593.1 PEGA domain-containing protein [Nannocystaceae bacterium]
MAEPTHDDELPPRHLLEALTVPTLPGDFTDRVMDRLHPPRAQTPAPTASRLPWAIAAVSMAIAATAVASLVMMRPREPSEAPASPSAIAPSTGAPPTEPRADAPAPAVVAAAAPVSGHVVLTLEPQDAQVRLDGALRDGTSPVVLTNLPLGPHTVQVERVGFEPWTQRIDIPDDVLQLSVKLVPIPAAPALDIGAFVPPPPRRAKRPVVSGTGASDLKDPFGVPAPSRGAAPSDTIDLKNPYATD